MKKKVCSPAEVSSNIVYFLLSDARAYNYSVPATSATTISVSPIRTWARGSEIGSACSPRPSSPIRPRTWSRASSTPAKRTTPSSYQWFS